MKAPTSPPLYYASLEDCKNDTNSIYEKESWLDEIDDSKKEELFDKVEKETIYTFTKVYNNYVLKSVK